MSAAALQVLIDAQARTHREHEELRRQVKDVKRRRLETQQRLGVFARTDWRYQQTEGHLRELAKASDALESKLVDAHIVRQQADAALQVALAEMRHSGTFVPPIVAAPPPQPPPPPAPPTQPNDAQMQHLRLLATKVRNDELKMRARLDAAQDFIAIALSVLPKAGGK